MFTSTNTDLTIPSSVQPHHNTAPIMPSSAFLGLVDGLGWHERRLRLHRGDVTGKGLEERQCCDDYAALQA